MKQAVEKGYSRGVFYCNNNVAFSSRYLKLSLPFDDFFDPFGFLSFKVRKSQHAIKMRKKKIYTLLFCKQKCISNVDRMPFYYNVRKLMRGISFI